MLALDAGQTEIRAALLTGRGPAPVAAAPGIVPFGDGVGPDVVADALLTAVRALGKLPRRLKSVGVGLSGFETAGDGELAAVADALRSELGVADVAIASDGVTSLLGALGDAPGCVVASGTGTIVVARSGATLGEGRRLGSDPRRRRQRLRDRACGSRRGAAASSTAGRADRACCSMRRPRASATSRDCPLLCAACRRGRACSRRSRRTSSPRLPTTPIAASIVERAAIDLAGAGAAALARVMEDGEAGTVACTGNVFRADALRDAFAVEIQRLRPGVLIAEPLGRLARRRRPPARACRPSPASSGALS